MTKIVYNACFGGFGLSDDAIRRYAEIKGVNLSRENGYYYFVSDDGETKWSDRDLERDDPVLAQVVEELGDNASGYYSRLHIRELEPGTRYRIDEYDGSETVMTMGEYDWQVA